MSATLSIASEEDVRPIVRELILAIMGPDVDEAELKICEERAMAEFYSGRGMTPHSEDVRRTIDGLALKFEVNGLIDLSTTFKRNVENFRTVYRKLTVEHPDVDSFSPSLTLNGCDWRILHFLHVMSRNPVQREVQRLKEVLDSLEINPGPSPKEQDKAKPFDWGAYLMEGIPIWNEPLTSDSDESQLSDHVDEDNMLEETSHPSCSSVVQYQGHLSQVLSTNRSDQPMLLPQTANEMLLWLKKEFNANAALISNTHPTWWTEASAQLILYKEPTVEIISEYSLIRELLWLLEAPSSEMHCFKLKDNLYVPTPALSIEGVDQETLWHFMNDMCDSINMVMEIEEFDNSLKTLDEYQCPKVFTAYNAALYSFLRSFKNKVADLELIVRKQDRIITLVHVWRTLKPLLTHLSFLTTIHRKATANWKTSPNWSRAVLLLSVWLEAALGVTLKQHVTIAFGIFLKSFQAYFRIIDHWLRFGDINDPSQEFIICRQPWLYGHLPRLEKMWALGFLVHPYKELVSCDPVSPNLLHLILTAGKSIDIIQSICRLDSVQPTTLYPVVEGIYLQFLLGIEHRLSHYQKEEYRSRNRGALSLPLAEEHPFAVSIKTLDNPNNTNLEQADSVFEDSYKQVYERIAEHTSRMFVPLGKILDMEENSMLKPTADLISKTLNTILVKEYYLDVRLAMLRTMFFLDHPHTIEVFNVLFTHRRLKDKLTNKSSLSMGIRDILEEICPMFNTFPYKLVVNDKFYGEEDLIPSMKYITYKYPVEWPVSLIIEPRHVRLYNEFFHFVLPLKWVLHAVSHLPTRVEKEDKKSALTMQRFLRYRALRFWLLSSLGGLNTCFLDYILQFYSKMMQDNMHKATDFEMLQEAHSLYMHQIYNLCGGTGKLKLFINQLVELAACFVKTWKIRDSIRMDVRLTDMENFYCTLHRQICRELNTALVENPCPSEEREWAFIYEGLICTFNAESLPVFGTLMASNRR